MARKKSSPVFQKLGVIRIYPQGGEELLGAIGAARSQQL
jgi:hypothetical protein